MIPFDYKMVQVLHLNGYVHVYCMCKLFVFNTKCTKHFDCNYIEGSDNRYWSQNLRKTFWNEENETINLQL